jgi:hypothetical protein
MNHVKYVLHTQIQPVEAAMRHTHRSVVVVLVLAGLSPAACHRGPSTQAKIKPAHVERVEGTGLSRVILTARAAERLNITTVPVREVQPTRSGSVHEVQMAQSGVRRKVVPYAAVLYDTHGDTWVYTSPEPLVFVRHRITIDRIAGDLAILADGPPAGTAVVTVGAAELFGTEFEIGH